MNKELILDYWNNFRHFDDGLEIFLSAHSLTKDEFLGMYQEYVEVFKNPWIEDILKS